jgi:hypothetical protein
MPREMNISHDEIENSNLIEKYLLGRLPEEEELAFEEHLLLCDNCRQKCLQTEKVMDALKQSGFDIKEEKKPLPQEKQFYGPRMLWRIAAMIVLTAGLTWLYFSMNKHPQPLTGNNISDMIDTMQQVAPEMITESDPETQHDKRPPSGSATESTGNKAGLTASTTDELLAAAYHTSPVFEEAIKNIVRGSGVQVIAPADSAVFEIPVTVSFDWESAVHKNVTLVVRKNTGEVVFMEPAIPPYRLKLDNAGLYYWQLLADDNVVHTGKFLIIH